MTPQPSADEATSQQAQSSNPIVFQCSGCSTIVSDSIAWICSHRELNTFTVSAVTKAITVSEELETSKAGLDLGSTTTALFCSKCNAVLGRIYKTTPRWLDGIRDMFTFNADMISSYELGSDEPNALVSTTNLFTASADQILNQMGKLELICVSLFERVGELEKELERANTNTGTNGANGPRSRSRSSKAS